MRYWLFKSEPTAYSFADLLAEENQTAEWDGVRRAAVSCIRVLYLYKKQLKRPTKLSSL